MEPLTQTSLRWSELTAAEQWRARRRGSYGKARRITQCADPHCQTRAAHGLTVCLLHREDTR